MGKHSIDGKKVMVTGGCGLIGSYITDLCLAKGCHVVIVDNLVKAVPTPGVDPEKDLREVPEWTKAQQAKFGDKVELQIGGVENKEFMRKALQGVEFIFHQAARGGFQRPFAPYFDSNVTGTAVMFDLIHEEGDKVPVKKVVAASSMAIYGEATYKRKSDGKIIHANSYRQIPNLEKQLWEYRCPETGVECEPVPIPEEHPANCISAYSNSKYCEERLCLAFAKELGIDCVCLRYSLTYGPRQSLHNPYTGLISIFSSLIMNDKAPTVYEDGNQTRDFVFVEDNAAANMACMESDATEKVFNVSWGKGDSVGKLADLLIKFFGKEATLKPKISAQFRPWDSRHMILDSTALQNATGWKPKVTFEEGVRKQMEWVIEEKKRGEKIVDYFTECSAGTGLVKEAAKKHPLEGGEDGGDAKKAKLAEGGV